MKTILLMASLLATGAATPPRNERQCVLRTLVAAPIPLDNGKLYFRGEPDRRQSYMAVFKGRCTGLNRLAAVSIESSGRRYCEGDRVRVLNPPSTLPGPICIIDRLAPHQGEADD